MDNKTLNEKAIFFDQLNVQIKSLEKVKGKLYDELKDEVKGRGLLFIDTGACRIDISSYTRKYPRKEKMDNFIINSGEDIKDYYFEKKIEKMQVVKKIDV